MGSNVQSVYAEHRSSLNQFASGLRVLHVVHSLSSAEGGGAFATAGWIRALKQKGVKVSVYATYALGNKDNLLQGSVDLSLFRSSFLSGWWPYHAFGLLGSLRKAIEQVDLVHLHNLWHYPQFAGYRICRVLRKPYLISPHGALQPAALRHKRFKKTVFMALLQRRILRGAAGFHAITPSEAAQEVLTRWGKPISIIPNGMDPKALLPLPPCETLAQHIPDLRGKRVILFLGRIHPIKGLDVLAEAFGKIARQRDDIRLVFVGPDTIGYRRYVEDVLQRHQVLGKTVFAGMLEGYDKKVALAGADVLVVPSYSEVRSLVALEAMACGLPVVLSRGCNFEEVAASGAGFVVDAKGDKLASAILTILENPALGREMGNNGRKLVAEHFCWDVLADRMVSFYEQVLHRVSTR